LIYKLYDFEGTFVHAFAPLSRPWSNAKTRSYWRLQRSWRAASLKVPRRDSFRWAS